MEELTTFLRDDPTAAAVAFLVTLAPLSALLFTLQSDRSAKQDADKRLQATNALQEQESAVATEAKDHGGLDLASLWPVTQKRIDFYHEIALEQSRKSFRNGQIAMIIGFLSVIGVGFLAAFAKNGTASIAAAAVGVAGAAMSGLIGATFLKSQTEASSQLRQFFSQPVELLRVLGAERLVEVLPEAERAEAVQQIIKSMTPTGNDTSPTAEPSPTKPETTK
jgi:hypothetical protein